MYDLQSDQTVPYDSTFDTETIGDYAYRSTAPLTIVRGILVEVKSTQFNRNWVIDARSSNTFEY